MTKPPTPRPAPDLLRILSSIDDLKQTVVAESAKNEARQEINSQWRARFEATLEDLKDQVRGIKNTASENLATTTNAYRQTNSRLDELQTSAGATVEEVAGQTAERVVVANRQESAKTRKAIHRGLGVAAVGGAGYALANWKSIVGFVIWASGGLSHLPPPG